MGAWKSYWVATSHLLIKNFKLMYRQWSDILIIILAPLLVTFFLWLSILTYANTGGFTPELEQIKNPDQIDLAVLPTCTPVIKPYCYTIAYVPNNSVTTQNGKVFDVGTWVNTIASQKNIPQDQVIGFANSNDLNAFFVKYPNVTQGAYVFEDYDFDNLAQGNITFQVQYNETYQQVFPLGSTPAFQLQVVPAMILAMQGLLIEEFTGVKMNISLKSSENPHPKLLNSANPLVDYGPLLWFGSYTLIIVLLLFKIAYEKEYRLRIYMKLMGQRHSQHFITWFLFFWVIMTFNTLSLIMWGAIFQFDIFYENNFIIYFLSFFLFGTTLSMWMFALDMICKDTEAVNRVAFYFYLINYLIGSSELFVYGVDSFGEPYLSDSTNWLRYLFAIFPATMFFRCVDLLAYATSNGGIHWDNVDTMRYFPIPKCWLWMIFPGAIAMGVAIIFDRIFGGGARKKFSWKSCFGRKKRNAAILEEAMAVTAPMPKEEDGQQGASGAEITTTTTTMTTATATATATAQGDPDAERAAQYSQQMERAQVTEEEMITEDIEEDVDVVAERDIIDRNDPEYLARMAIVIRHIRKEFKKNVAVSDITFGVEKSSLFALLGHNGAGKSTLFNMLSGILPVTSGDAFIYGLSVAEDQDEIRKIMGVCPQHDILWNNLTAAEHIELYAALRGLSNIPEEVERRLEQVDLLHVKDGRSSEFSGGMQRRLSVAISLTGDPKIVLLDEPSSGSDPISRRQIWEMIESAKKGRVIVLITHSMEEADVLGDRVGIVARGKLRVIGTSLRLKNKFGAGYKLTAVCASSEPITDFVMAKCGKSKVHDVNELASGEVVVELLLPRMEMNELENLVKAIEQNKESLGIRSFSINQTSLEEVFLMVAKLSAEEEEELPELKGCGYYLKCKCCCGKKEKKVEIVADAGIDDSNEARNPAE
eukprot:CAMPEP_0184696420 /NCGR_PEP_ID=MMETSP0313-20130426/3723_1 /TAXON_ID=2792 /ORGANISM="Porphyridium aerugineum, Strain SAG 1380-2" /LENGTH=930 /DNA_ID=CAMNT_0027155047 /DNA_START=116 /DNA_END=2908 /DNA_ORIENTATION=-